jgi:hypothetical protein
MSVPDATVRFRGRTLCETPCTTPPLPAGRQVLTFVRGDGRAFSRAVTVPADGTGRHRFVLPDE